MPSRRNILIGAGVAAAAVVAGGAYMVFAQQPAAGPKMTAVAGAVPNAPGAEVDMAKLMAPAGNVPEHPIGNAEAKVVVIEYLSPSCPHCAAFEAEVLPQLKTQYIDTGKILYLPRPFVRNVLDSAVFMLAEAAGADKYQNVVETFFKTQNTWVLSPTPDDAIRGIAKQLGFTDDSYNAALTNQALFTGMEAMRDQATKDFKVQGTPTFYINGKILDGEQSLDDLKKVIDPLLG